MSRSARVSTWFLAVLLVSTLAAWCIAQRWRSGALAVLMVALVFGLPSIAGTQPGQASNDMMATAILRREGVTRVVLVAHGFDMPRARAEFAAAGLETIPAPTGLPAPAHGTALINANGTISYTPDANFNGADAFTYTLEDGGGHSATARVSVTVAAVNEGTITSGTMKRGPAVTMLKVPKLSGLLPAKPPALKP